MAKESWIGNCVKTLLGRKHSARGFELQLGKDLEMKILLKIGYDGGGYQNSEGEKRMAKYIKKLNQFHSSISDTIIHLLAWRSKLENHFSIEGSPDCSTSLCLQNLRRCFFEYETNLRSKGKWARWRLSRWDYGNISMKIQRDRICRKFPSPLWACELFSISQARPCPCHISILSHKSRFISQPIF